MAAKLIGKTMTGHNIWYGTDAERLAKVDETALTQFVRTDGARFGANGAGGWNQIGAGGQSLAGTLDFDSELQSNPVFIYNYINVTTQQRLVFRTEAEIDRLRLLVSPYEAAAPATDILMTFMLNAASQEDAATFLNAVMPQSINGSSPVEKALVNVWTKVSRGEPITAIDFISTRSTSVAAVALNLTILGYKHG